MARDPKSSTKTGVKSTRGNPRSTLPGDIRKQPTTSKPTDIRK